MPKSRLIHRKSISSELVVRVKELKNTWLGVPKGFWEKIESGEVTRNHLKNRLAQVERDLIHPEDVADRTSLAHEKRLLNTILR